MALKVSTPPGFVVVTCGNETVVVAGVLVAPPAGSKTAFPISVRQGAPTTWIPAVQGPRPPPPTGRGRGGVSTQITTDMSDRFVSLALSGGHVDLVAPEAEPLNKLLASGDFVEFNRAMCGPYALTVSPGLGMTAKSTSVVIGDMAPSVLTKNWNPNG